jgi:hypothetical protein
VESKADAAEGYAEQAAEAERLGQHRLAAKLYKMALLALRSGGEEKLGCSAENRHGEADLYAGVPARGPAVEVTAGVCGASPSDRREGEPSAA